MKLDLIQLDDFYILKLSVVSVFESINSAEYPKQPFINLDVFKKKDAENNWALKLTIKAGEPSTESKPGLEVSIELIGKFSFSVQTTEAEKQYLIRVNGGTILYGVARGILASATGSFPSGKYVLPSVYMQEFVKEEGTETSDALKNAKKPLKKSLPKRTSRKQKSN